MRSPFSPRSPVEFEAFFQKNLGWPIVHSNTDILLKTHFLTNSGLNPQSRDFVIYSSTLYTIKIAMCEKKMFANQRKSDHKLYIATQTLCSKPIFNHFRTDGVSIYVITRNFRGKITRKFLEF